MSTFSLTADKLGYVTRTSYSSWTLGKADQGRWTGGYPRVGAMLFSQLRDGIDWSEQNINAIRLTVKPHPPQLLLRVPQQAPSAVCRR